MDFNWGYFIKTALGVTWFAALCFGISLHSPSSRKKQKETGTEMQANAMSIVALVVFMLSFSAFMALAM